VTNIPIRGAERPLRQRVRYVTASDGTRLAWAEAGSGATVVKAANWLTHLEYEWESPVWRHWIQFFSSHFHFVRSDERGCGMSDWQVGRLSLDQWTDDLASVIDAAQAVLPQSGAAGLGAAGPGAPAPAAPVTLLGISQGGAACIRYAIAHPERVSRLILYGSYAHGALKRGVPGAESAYRAMTELARVAWGRDNPTFRQVFTSRFIPGGSREQLDWFNDLCLKTTSGEMAAQLFEARAVVDIEALLPLVRTPTLVLHARNDEVVPFAEGRLLAGSIPGAEFVELDSRNHVLLDGESAWHRFCAAVLAFVESDGAVASGAAGSGVEAGPGAAFAALSPRELEVLGLLTDGLSNADIAQRMHISEKTVRNHASNLFDKLGVWSRSQAIVFARDHGFRRA
jgi:pimeloyl-ACP methyl ester carboxylesterase/DNA-binding CsgD family transcriptional regulator